MPGLAEVFDDALGGSQHVWRPATATQLVAGALARTAGPDGRPNVSAAARSLGVPRRTLRNWITGSSAIPPARFRSLAARDVAMARRAALPAGKESDIRAGRVRLTLVGAQTEVSTRRTGRHVTNGVEVRQGRRLDVGAHIPPHVISGMVDSWLAGNDLATIQNQLTEVLNDYYAQGVDVTRVGRADFR